MRRLILCAAAMLVSLAAFARESGIHDIKIDLRLQKDGTAAVTEVWDITPTQGTEWYLVRSNLGDISIGNLSVSDETGLVYTDEGDWDVDRSISKKAGKCGMVRKRDGVEICWGIGSYGHHVFTVSYTMTCAVKSLYDADMLHMQLVSPGLSSTPDHMSATISAEGLSKENTRFWGFGFEGESSMSGNTVSFESTGKIKSMIVLLRFDKGLFDSPSTQSRGFEDVLAVALDGAHFEDEGGKTTFFEKVVGFIMGILPLLIAVLAFVGVKQSKKRILGCSPKEVSWSREVPFGGNLEESYYTLKQLGMNKKGNTYASSLILRMVYKGAIVVNKNDDKADLMFNDAHFEELTQSESQLYTMLKEASGSDEILQDKEFSKWSRKHYQRVNNWITGIDSTAKSELAAGNLSSGYKYTPDGQAEARKLLGFKKFLNDFTLMDERGTREVGLWQDYLVFGALFGIADKVAKELHDIDPKFFEEAVAQDFNTFNWILYRNTMMSNDIINAQSRASEAMSRSSGSFGGFGGGTSFGGGGGFSGGGFGGGSR